MIKEKLINAYDELKALPRYTKVGIAGVCLAFLAITSIYAGSLVWLGTGDSPQHLDYVWQVSQGQLPKFDAAIQYPPIEKVSNYTVQYVSQHPPLYYAILAPFLTGFLEAGDWKYAVALGRILNIFIGLLCVLAFSWAGYVFGGRRRHLFAVALPAVAVFYGSVIAVTGDIMSDMLAVLFSTLAFICIYKLLTIGPAKRYVVCITLLSGLGMSSRAAYAATLFVSILALVISYYLYDKKRLKGLMKGALASVLVLLFVLLTSGWFYYFHNYQVSGSWTRSGQQDWISYAREYKSFDVVISSKNLYYSAMHIYSNYPSIKYTVPLTISILVSGVAWLVIKYRLERRIPSLKVFSVVSLMVIHYLISFAGQVQHAVGYGQYSSRYFLLSLLPFALLMTYGLLAYNKITKAQLVTLFVLLNVGGFLLRHNSYLANSISPKLYGDGSIVENLKVSFGVNGIPEGFVYVLGVMFIAGIVLMAYSLWQLSTRNRDTDRAASKNVT